MMYIVDKYTPVVANQVCFGNTDTIMTLSSETVPPVSYIKLI